MQISLFQPLKPSSWSVTALTRYLRDLLASDTNLQDLWVQGEISNFSRPSSGHWYFTVKDNNAALKCVIWRNVAMRQNFVPRDGDAVEIHGAIGVYETSGVYQLYADSIRPTGAGALYQKFLQLKARLEAEGLFDPARKRPISKWPRIIGIVTSPTGAALRDMLNTLRRRFPLAQVILSPTAVQGNDAAPGICQAIQTLGAIIYPESQAVILVARGGGSIEDLWAFNDKRVARAIVSSPVPIITGIGHETDFTIADFAADLRAPTPTAAAELATPNRDDLLVDWVDLGERLQHAAENILATYRWTLNNSHSRLRLQSPQARLRSDRQRLDDQTHRAEVALAHHFQLQRAHLSGLQQRLSALNPLLVLARGYAVVSHPDGTIVRSIDQVHPGDTLQVRVSDGQFTVRSILPPR